MNDEVQYHSENNADAPINIALQVLWPAFLGAVCGVGILFSLVDPAELRVVNGVLNGSVAGAYTIGFFLFWLVTTLACSITLFLRRSAHN
ncbi:MAG: hypothetical protein WBD34_17415 [Burkholderiaceae bacterium]